MNVTILSRWHFDVNNNKAGHETWWVTKPAGQYILMWVTSYASHGSLTMWLRPSYTGHDVFVVTKPVGRYILLISSSASHDIPVGHKQQLQQVGWHHNSVDTALVSLDEQLCHQQCHCQMSCQLLRQSGSIFRLMRCRIVGRPWGQFWWTQHNRFYSTWLLQYVS